MPIVLEGNAALLAGFRAGDRAALTSIYRAYVEEVARAVRAGVRVSVDGQPVRLGTHPSEADVEVVLQETFLRAFSATARARYDGVRSFGAYLATIARNVVIDRARAARQHARVVPLDDDDQVADADRVDPLARIEDEQLRAAVNAAVASLSERDRAVFTLRYVEGLTQADVAERLHLARITVRRVDASVRHQILAHLRNAGHLREVAVGIPRFVRDRSSG